MASYNPTHLIDKFLTQEWDSFVDFLCEELDLDWQHDREQLMEAAEDIANSI